MWLMAVLAIGMALRAERKIFAPDFFGNEYELIQVDSVKRGAGWLPSQLYALEKNGRHIGYAMYLIGYVDYSWYGESTTHIDRHSGNAVVYFLGNTKERALEMLNKMEELTKAKRAGNSLNGNLFKMDFKKGNVFYEEYYTKLVGHDETQWRVRYGTVGGLSTFKGIFISSEELQPAFLSLKVLKKFREDIEKYPQSELASWENEKGDGLVRFSNPIKVHFMAMCAYTGFGGSDMFLFEREYSAPDDPDFPATLDGFRPYWTYTIEDPSSQQGSLLNVGDDLDQAIATLDELKVAYANLQKFHKEHKIWAFPRSSMPEGYIYFDDIPLEEVHDGMYRVKITSSWPELMWTYNLDFDTKGVWTNTKVLDNIQKIYRKEQKNQNK